MPRFLLKILLCVVLFSVSPAYAMTSGTMTSGTIPLGDMDTQTFTGTAGQGIIIHASASFNVTITINKPDGSYWSYGTNRFTGTLPDTGTYTVELTAGGSSGSYDLYYVRGSGGVSDGSLTSGQTASDTLAVNALTSYQFTGTAGQGIALHTSAAYSANIYVYKPDGSYWDAETDRYRKTLPDTGTYTVVVAGTNYASNGTYDLYYFKGDDSVSSGTLISGQASTTSLDENGMVSYQFYGVAGQGVKVHTSSGYSATILGYEPDGSYWTYGTNRFSKTLPSTGTYNLLIMGANYASNGTLGVNFVRGDDSVNEGTLVSGSERAGNLPLNGLESYKFTGVASNSLTVSTTASFSRTMYVYRPDGSYWTYGSSSMSKTLPETGEYTLVFYGNSTGSNGAYDITLTTPPAPVTASTASKSGGMYQSCPQPIQNPTTANPINFDLGYKIQTEVDYDAGGLKFSRIYRSDSTWTDNTIGALWRHNYARTLDVGGSTVEITDGTGATTDYTLSGSDWVPDDPETTATFVTDGSEYVYTLPDNTVERYNSSEQLIRIEYVGGGALDLTYNGSGQLITITNENGRQLSLTYSSGRVATLVTPDGTYSYSYDGNNNLDEVTRPDTETREYHYEDATYVNALTGITDEGGVRFATFDYDGNGKAILSEHAGSVDDYDVTYNVDGTATTTNPLGKDTTYHFTNILGLRRVVQVDGEASANCVASNRFYNYDNQGRVMSKTDWENNTTRYEYDDRSNITKITKAAGTAEEQVTTITYDTTYNLPELVMETGKTTDYDYDAYGRMTSKTITDTNTAEARTTTYTYYANSTDANGNLVLGRLEQIDGPRTDVTDTTDYDYDGNLNLISITNALGHETEITARDSAGRPTTIEDANDVETDLVYDSNGWLESSTRAPGTGLEAETTYDYDANGNLTVVTLPNGATLTYSYDNAQRLTGVEDDLGNTITYTLDAAGNITQEDIKDTGATLKYTHDQVFDELSRIIESVGASAQTSEYGYDKNSNLTTYTDANTNDTDYAYDGLQRLVSSTDALSGLTELDYNDLDNLTSVEDQRDNSTTYTYNAFGDVTGETSPDRGTISYTHDKAGNITQMTDARSVVTDYTYDALNRLTDIEYPSDSSLDAELTYDLMTGCGPAPKGQLCKVEDAAGVTEYEYDDLGRLTDVTETRGALTFTTSFSYDLAGNVTGITLPSGRDITYTLNGNGQVSGVSAEVNSTPTSLASSITYLPFGPMNAMTYGNSLTFSATYDQDYYLTNRTVSGGIYNHTYDTDDNGNITQVGGTDYEYDELNRLDSEDSGSAVTYTYDATSNRLTKVDGGTTSTTVPAGSNKISAVGANSYSYDAAGNITDDGVNDYTWNAANQLDDVEISSVTVGEYTYDSQNRRVKKVASSVTTHYVYGLNGLLYGEYDNSGNLIREYVYLNGAPLAQIDDVSSSDVLTYLHTDHLGTPRFATNTGGTQVWAANADAFGVGTPSGSVTVNLRMPGQYYDTESGLFYNWNRYYNPAIGRYISSDPIGIDGGLNTFLYAIASPVMYDDPRGLDAGVSAATASTILQQGGRVCVANPVLCATVGPPVAVGGAALGTGIAIGYHGTGFIAECLSNDAADGENDQQRAKEHAEYKELLKTKNYPDPDNPCDHHLKESKRHQQAADMMKAFDQKYNLGDRHKLDIAREERLARRDMKRYHACKAGLGR